MIRIYLESGPAGDVMFAHVASESQFFHNTKYLGKFMSTEKQHENIYQVEKYMSMLWRMQLQFATFRSARSPGSSMCKRGLPVQFSVQFNHFQTTNS